MSTRFLNKNRSNLTNKINVKITEKYFLYKCKLQQYTGNVQTFTAPSATTYKLEVWGAQGGSSGGNGGYSVGNKTLSSSNNLYICVGSAGGNYSGNNGGSGGYNGGGKGGTGFQGGYSWTIAGGGGGGGATHIAITNNRGVLKNYVNNKNEILIVAGGGGGNGHGQLAGTGGGTNGGNAISSRNTYTISGATQTSGYAFGQGQDGKTKTQAGDNGAEGNGGGGGGYYGGPTIQNVGTGSNCSGTGGSGYIGGVTNGTTTAGVSEGNGKALITWMTVL